MTVGSLLRGPNVSSNGMLIFFAHGAQKMLGWFGGFGFSGSYEQIRFDPAEKNNRVKQVAGPEEANGAARINQAAEMFLAKLATGVEIRYSLALKRSGYLHLVRGEVAVNGIELHTGDAAACER